MSKVANAIDQIPGPRVSSYLLGHLSLLWQAKGKTDWFQRRCFLLSSSPNGWLFPLLEIFNTFIGITKIYQQQSVGFMRFWIGPAQPVVVIFDAECAEVGRSTLDEFL